MGRGARSPSDGCRQGGGTRGHFVKHQVGWGDGENVCARGDTDTRAAAAARTRARRSVASSRPQGRQFADQHVSQRGSGFTSVRVLVGGLCPKPHGLEQRRSQHGSPPNPGPGQAGRGHAVSSSPPASLPPPHSCSVTGAVLTSLHLSFKTSARAPVASVHVSGPSVPASCRGAPGRRGEPRLQKPGAGGLAPGPLVDGNAHKWAICVLVRRGTPGAW